MSLWVKNSILCVCNGKYEKYLQKVRDTNVPAELKELKECILKTGCTIEQESMLFSRRELCRHQQS